MAADSNWEVPDHSIQISVDRGGTFSDVHASFLKRGGAEGDRDELVIKLLSVDKNNYEDAPTVSTLVHQDWWGG
jgi:5-oxoprolinase (ATP-hydrolysing)